MSATDLSQIVASAEAGRAIAVDTETDGAPTHVARLRLVSVSDGAAVVLLEPGVHDRTLELLLSRPYTWVAHNAEYDRQVLTNNLGYCPVLLDTFAAAHLVDSRSRFQGGPGLSLADLAEFYLGERKLGRELKDEMRRGGWDWATVPVDNPVYRLYAAHDARLTARLWNEYLHTDDPLLAFEGRVSRACGAMSARGFAVDAARAEELRRAYESEAAVAAERGRVLGCRNIYSVPQVRSALGVDDTSKAALLALQCPLSEAVLAGRHARKMASTYAAAFLRDSARDGRLHPNIKGLGTRTGRMSSSSPNLQNVPKDRIRECLVADDGNVVWAADFKGIEIRVLAALSQDERLIEAILGGRSLHDDTSVAIFGPEYTPEQRHLAKIGVFATLYGAGYKALMRQLSVDESTARAIHGGLFKAYPGVGRFDRRMRSMAERLGYVETRSGRRLKVDKDKAYGGTNYAIQGTAAELFKVSLLQVLDAGLGDYLLVPVHDELVGQAPTAEAYDVLGRVVAAMATTLDGVPIEANGKVGGRSWGSLYGAAD